MPLILPYQMETGFTADFWKVERVTLDIVSKRVDIELSLYKDQASFTAGNTPVRQVKVSWAGNDIPFTLADIRSLGMKCYNKLKEGIQSAMVDSSINPDWTSATISTD